ncbi:Vegetative incompatibility protein HET-E-1 [Ceratocystis lukuohia]|uniref:Vegetative incompatibility protein HET-E-1 n=1 Tax=Ceratocystis lukuohia TaxID=2019550 RepID=A0ABR4M977_9PEZI
MSSSKPLAATESPVRILCLDGGGVRGLSSLLILEKIMEKIKESEHLSEVPKPCDKFGFIGGTGTGGIIAIMLGRLRMGVNQSIEAYKRLASTAFVAESTPTTSPSAFSAMKLEIAIKQMVRTNCGDPQCLLQRKSGGSATDAETCQHEDMLFLDEHCTKTAVLAMTKANLDTLPTLLTTYDTSERFMGCKVWNVARATSAAVTFFDSIKLGRDDIEFIDASYGYNNPCEVLIREAKKQFPDEEMIILSIGAGLGDVVEIKDSKSSVLEALSTMAASSKQTDLRLRETYGRTKVYHRFNVQNGLKDTSISDWHELSNISAHTMNYLNENNDVVMQFVTAFTGRGVSQPTIYHDEKDKQCLIDLCVTDPRTDKKSIENKKGGLLKDCYQWIVKHKDFQRFLNESESRILWIKGDPGKGKTMLLCGIIDQLDSDKSVSLSYFFCQAAGNQANTATSVLRGLIYYLAYYNPHLTKYVRSKYDYRKDIFVHENAWHDLCEILTTMLNDPSLSDAILVVDALDECNTGRKELLEFIAQSSRAKWIVSSRNWPDIEEILDDAEQKVKIHLEVNQSSVSDAVDLYIQAKVDKLARKKRYDDKMKIEVLEHLRSNADGTFLWVALVCQELSNANARTWHTPTKLKSFPPGLNPLYARMLQQISQSDDAQLCKDIIATALVVYRPITLKELHALVHELEQMQEENVTEVIALCGSFLTVHENVISFVHQSAKDYLSEKALNEIVPSGMPYQHQKVLLRSLEILHQRLKRDIYGLKAPGCLIHEVLVPEPDPLAAIRYPCTFWADHLEDSAGDVASTNDGILVLFKDKYLQWLEALSLLRSISSAGWAMEKLRPFLEKGSQDLQEIAKDAQRFLLFYGGGIEIAPLQVYVSALIFSPTKSAIRQMYSHEEPDWIEPKPRVEENWDVCLQTLEGHHNEVTSVVFSNDGQRLASGSYDKTVKIWDATSGACLQTLEGHHDEVTSVVFSNDGQRLASGSKDKTVKIWDATSGACLQALEGHYGAVTSVVFSNDGQRLASGSGDKTVKIWDATSGACLQTLEGHESWVTSVVFSNDGQRLASGSGDSTVKIWDATSGACLQTLEGHHNWVTSAIFSNDGQRLASGSGDETVKIWDATSGACLQTLEGHYSWVTSVVFSNDGQRLVSGSWDETVKIWDATSGACLQTLEGHHDEVTSVVFSNDGQRLASGSSDKTVKIWDATSGACLQTLEGHHHPVTSAIFSNDGQRLASGSGDKTVKIWDATSGACLQTLEGHQSWVTSVVFSNDGQRVASGSDDKTVKIWDATSGACLQTLEDHYGAVTSVVFSNDRQQSSSSSLADQTSLLPSKSNSHIVAIDGVWITEDQRRVLWLPPSYRRNRPAFTPGKIGLSFSSGRVTIIGFRSTDQHQNSGTKSSCFHVTQ